MSKNRLSGLPKMDVLLARPELAGCPLPYALVRRVARQLARLGAGRIWTGHCTGNAARAILQEELGERLQPPLTTGLSIEL